MSVWTARRRSTRIVLVLALMLLGGFALISAANAEGDKIILITGDDGTVDGFYYNGVSQPLDTATSGGGKTECTLTDASLSGLVTMTATAADKKGAEVPGVIGFVEEGLGVSLRTGGNAQDCGRIDKVTETAEALKLALGTNASLDDKMISKALFDFEAKYDANVVIDFFRFGNPTPVATSNTIVFGQGSDDGPDAKFNDKYKVWCSVNGTNATCVKGGPEPAAGDLFDAVRIRPTLGGVSLEGGATWQFKPGDSPANHRTEFVLADATTSLNTTLEVSRDGANWSTPASDFYVPVDDPVYWKVTVRNDGAQALSNVTVPGCLTPGVNLAAGAETTCTMSETSLAGLQTKTVNASGTFYGVTVNASPTSGSYFGSRIGISIDVTTNGTDGPDIPVGGTVTWAYVVRNTGNVPLTSVAVTDDNGTPGDTSDDFTPTLDSGDTNSNNALDPTEVWTYSATGTAIQGPYTNAGTASATPPADTGTLTPDSDSSSYFGYSAGLVLSISNSGTAVDGFDDPLIDVSADVADPKVTWTYTITNTGNVDLDSVALEDSFSESDNCPATIAAGAQVTCSKQTDAGRDLQTNTGTVSGQWSGGPVVSAPASSSYFGSFPDFEITVSPDSDPAPVAVGSITWQITVENTGNVPLTIVGVSLVGVDDNGCSIGTLDVGESKTCSITQTVTPTVEENGIESSSFKVEGNDPLGGIWDETTGAYEYYPGYGCDVPTQFSGGPDLDDTPYAGFYVGPLKFEGECAIPIVLTTDSTLNDDTVADSEEAQTVYIGPPLDAAGDPAYDWAGVTGLLTVQWDVEDPSLAGVRPTFQGLPGELIEIPDCTGDIAVQYDDPAPGEFAYTLVDNPLTLNGTYPLATDGGNICLVFHLTETINYPSDETPVVVKTRTTEVFYIYNDPLLSRPR